MAAVNRRAIALKKRVVLLRKESKEAWTAAHDVAMLCFEREELVKDAVELFDDICRLDERWSSHVYDNPEVFDEEVDSLIKRLFSAWHRLATKTLRRFEEIRGEYTSRNFKVSLADDLRARHRQCAAILNPREDEVSELAEKALDEHRRGTTEEFLGLTN